MRNLIITIFGNYEPITYQQFVNTIDSSTGNNVTVLQDTIPDGFAGCDWTYILGVLAFIVVLYGVLRIIGGVISRV